MCVCASVCVCVCVFAARCLVVRTLISISLSLNCQEGDFILSVSGGDSSVRYFGNQRNPTTTPVLTNTVSSERKSMALYYKISGALC